jgi:hypothetical protein
VLCAQPREQATAFAGAPFGTLRSPAVPAELFSGASFFGFCEPFTVQFRGKLR